MYTSGLNIMDTDISQKNPIEILFLRRFAALDSLLVPFIFTFCLLTGIFKKHRALLKIIFVPYVFYYLIYYFAVLTKTNYVFHFRAFLPFVYIFGLIIKSIYIMNKYSI